VPGIVALSGKCPWGAACSWDHLLFVMFKMGTILWQLLDHCRWLQSMKFMRGNPKQTNCLSFR
jgi:hypothetical protein